MRAVGYQRSLPADDPEALVDIELPVPETEARDLLVGIRAVSVNPGGHQGAAPRRAGGGRLEGAGLQRRGRGDRHRSAGDAVQTGGRGLLRRVDRAR